MAERAGVVHGASQGLLFPEVPALVARDGEGFVLLDPGGARWHVSGLLAREIERSLLERAPTAELRRLGAAHVALARLTGWLATPAVPLSREHAVRLDGFDTIFVELLGQCNEQCIHCYAESAPTVTDALERDVVFRVIDDAASAGFRRIQFTGGDPLLCDFLPEAAARAAATGRFKSIEIYTNGLALQDRLLDALAPSRPSFAFSFYSIDPDVHDRITRTPGSQRRTLAAIDRVVARGLDVRVAIVVMQENADRVDELIELLRARGVQYVSWSRTFTVGRGVDVAAAGGVTDARGGGPSIQAEQGGHRAPARGGRSGLGKLAVTYTGDVVPCIFQRRAVLGNVRSGRSLEEIATTPTGRAGRRGLPVANDARARLQCASCRLTDAALSWLGDNPDVVAS
ncbi:MAG TPA: radical SAM protein [Kofleriaceae bacterium]|nr:radical SAM protein [Kofleriaceae bacterium]